MGRTKAAFFLLLIAAACAVPRSVPAVSPQPGAAVAWNTYEAEQADTNGAVLGPDFTGRTPAREASGRRCVCLKSAGQFIEFAAATDAQAMVVRYCIPDAPGGGGAEATLSLTIAGRPQPKLRLTSRYAFLYGPYPFANNPAVGAPRHFWDELRLMPGPIHRGERIRLEKGSDDAASEYLIDCVDLETVGPPLAPPPGSVSVLDHGAAADGSIDSRPAFQAAIRTAQSRRQIVWIPPGRFLISGPIVVSNVTLCGAGMWYSTLVGAKDYSPSSRVAVYGGGSNITLSDFAIIGNLTYRNDGEANDGLGGSFGTGSHIRRVWVEHTKTGAWLTNSDGLSIEDCRFRNTVADGINLCVGMRNTVVRNCTARGTGDDCFAMWPADYAKAAYSPGCNRFVHCTASLPFLAQGFAVYGGEENTVEQCQATDVPYGAGLLASTSFPTQFGFRGETRFTNSRIIRCGDEDGAIGTCANLLDLPGLRFTDIVVIDSPRDGIKFTSVAGHALIDAVFSRVHIARAGLAGSGYGVFAPPKAVGSASLDGVSTSGTKGIQIQSRAFALTVR